ncbi:MAG: DUF58 domain-containing protein [Thermoleophilia bacterium]|nr:DUF58 domain-containing protein [Thermoleophilia bacterium]
MPRPTVRGYALLGLALVTYLAGRVLGTWELYLFAFGFLAAVIVSWATALATGRRVKVTRTLIPERPVAGDEPEIEFLLKNGSLLPGPELTLRSPLAGLSSESVELEVDSLGPHSERMLKAHAGRVNRGVHVLPAAEALAEDALGITKVVHKITDPLVVTVFPRIAHLDSCALYPELGLRHEWTGRRGITTFGASEFKGVRPHQPGEPLSHIDWKTTAKTGILMLREMEEPAGADVTLLLDGTAQSLVGDPPDNNFELAVRAAGSIADYVLRANRGVTLLCHERSWRHVQLTADGGGRRALMQALAETQPNASAPLANALRHLRTDGPHLLRTQSVTVVSISLDRQLARALVQLREDGVSLSFLYVVGDSFSAKPGEGVSSLLPFLPPRDTSTSPEMPRRAPSLSAEDRALLLTLSSSGIPSLTLDRGDDLVRGLALRQTGPRAAAAP